MDYYYFFIIIVIIIVVVNVCVVVDGLDVRIDNSLTL